MISIITITYNDFNGLKRTLSSIPDFDFLESVVINGGTDKSTLEYLSSYKGKAINEKDEGIADAFNKGIANSTGDAIMFLNSGDELIDNEYIRLTENILSHKKEIAFVHSNMLLIDQEGTQLFMKPPFCNPGRGLPYLHPTMIVRKSAFNQIGSFDKKFKIAMDFDFVVRLVKKNYKGFYVSDKYVVKMEGSGRSIEHEFEAIKECYKSLKQNNFLTLTNCIGLVVRIKLFMLRKFLVLIGLGSSLKKLKMKKHSPSKI